MAGKTYICLGQIWSRSENKGYRSGDEIELPDDVAEILLKKNKVKAQAQPKPAAKQEVTKQSKDVEGK